MLDDIKAIYTRSWAFALALPLLFIVPAIPEFLQHIVEIKIGMYAGLSSARAVAHDGSRMAFGYAKTLALILPSYWLTRYMAWQGDARRARTLEWPAIGLWLILFGLEGAQMASDLFGPSTGSLIGLTGRHAQVANGVIGTITSVIGIYLTCWLVAWPLGHTACGPLTSIRLMIGSFWRTIGYMVAGILPLMIVHYALGWGSLGRPAWLLWPMLVVDALVVAMLAHTIAASNFVAARHAAARRGYSLLPAATPDGAYGAVSER